MRDTRLAKESRCTVKCKRIIQKIEESPIEHGDQEELFAALALIEEKLVEAEELLDIALED